MVPKFEHGFSGATAVPRTHLADVPSHLRHTSAAFFTMDIDAMNRARERYNVPSWQAITHDLGQVVRSSQSTQSTPASVT